MTIIPYLNIKAGSHVRDKTLLGRAELRGRDSHSTHSCEVCKRNYQAVFRTDYYLEIICQQHVDGPWDKFHFGHRGLETPKASKFVRRNVDAHILPVPLQEGCASVVIRLMESPFEEKNHLYFIFWYFHELGSSKGKNDNCDISQKFGKWSWMVLWGCCSNFALV